ncbi:MAG: ATP-grasp domain-containing protein [Bacteroidia bacterium]|jgi:carbamoyl-phosphate synthase large subunit
MQDQINILFLGGAKRVSLAECLIAAGKQLGKTVNIFSYELDKYVPIASIGKIIIGLKWNNPDILTHLGQTIKENNIHIVLPFVDGATVIAAQLKTQVKEVFIPVSPEQTCDIMFDKVKANEWFQANGIPVPAYDGHLPAIAKPRKGSASQGLVIIKTEQDKSSFKANYKEEDFLIQRFLTADEYTVDVYVSKQGRALSIVPRKRMEVTSGEVTKSITVRDEEVIALSKEVISKIRFEGPITLQFLRDKQTKQLYMMEINPRFGGGVVTSIQAGADSCSMLLNEYLNNPVKEVTDWKENLIMTRAFREFFYHANNN